mmetsp:Transcript_22994/g.35816  ORF Transcript_22994/g.35816 Transcript_22994/m.35816 type:complete len:96 (+) Transcript_22994:642-929(+)
MFHQLQRFQTIEEDGEIKHKFQGVVPPKQKRVKNTISSEGKKRRTRYFLTNNDVEGSNLKRNVDHHFATKAHLMWLGHKELHAQQKEEVGLCSSW